MIRYRLETELGPVFVSLDLSHAAGDADEVAPLVYEGDALAVELVREWLEDQAGRYGHLIGRETSAIDLAVALAGESARVFAPVRAGATAPSAAR